MGYSPDCRRAIKRAQDCFDRGQFDVGIDSGSPTRRARLVFQLDVRYGGGFFTRAKGVLAIRGNFKLRQTGQAEPVDQSR